MANPLPNEEEIYRQIKNEKITIDPGILDFLYHYIGDDISAINLLCQYYLMDNSPMPAQETRRILLYTKDIEFIIKNITKVSLENASFPRFKENDALHKIVRDLLMYHFGNDIYVINLIVQDAIDPLKGQSFEIQPAAIRKILDHTFAIKKFMEKLRLATTP
ncbi:MAG: hypothetical protein PHN57_02995 [Candidatus Omnitrophica bacterium]|nr:hypothetical protein [Candidatus Omnitrophota bacterium]